MSLKDDILNIAFGSAIIIAGLALGIGFLYVVRYAAESIPISLVEALLVMSMVFMGLLVSWLAGVIGRGALSDWRES